MRGRFKSANRRAEVLRGPARRPPRRARQAAVVHERQRRPGGRALVFYKVPVDRIVAVHDELDLPVRVAAAQARRGRQRPQRPEVDAPLAGERRVRPCAVRGRPPARPAGPRRLRAARLRGGRATRTSLHVGARPTRWRRCSPTDSSAPRHVQRLTGARALDRGAGLRPSPTI